MSGEVAPHHVAGVTDRCWTQLLEAQVNGEEESGSKQPSQNERELISPGQWNSPEHRVRNGSSNGGDNVVDGLIQAQWSWDKGLEIRGNGRCHDAKWHEWSYPLTTLDTKPGNTTVWYQPSVMTDLSAHRHQRLGERGRPVITMTAGKAAPAAEQNRLGYLSGWVCHIVQNLRH